MDDLESLVAAFAELERRMEGAFNDRWSWTWIFHKVLGSGDFPELSARDIEPLWQRWWQRHSSESEQIDRLLLAAEHYLREDLPNDLAKWDRYSNLGRRQCEGAWRYEEMRRNRLVDLDRQGRLNPDQQRRLQVIRAVAANVDERIFVEAKPTR